MTARIERLTTLTPADAWEYLPGLIALLKPFASVLLDDAHLEDGLSGLAANILAESPYVWWLRDIQSNRILAAATLSDIEPGKEGRIHGVVSPDCRRHPRLPEMSRLVLQEAFERLGFQRLLAEFETNNQGARGFCLQHGFRPDSFRPRANRVLGVWRDVAVYALSRARYQQWMEETYNHADWTQEKDDGHPGAAAGEQRQLHVSAGRCVYDGSTRCQAAQSGDAVAGLATPGGRQPPGDAAKRQ